MADKRDKMDPAAVMNGRAQTTNLISCEYPMEDNDKERLVPKLMQETVSHGEDAILKYRTPM